MLVRICVILFALTGAILWTAHPVHAREANFAVMGVRLGMSAAEVLQVLSVQGADADHLSVVTRPCALPGTRKCIDTISTRLADGPITVRFAEMPKELHGSREVVYSITYSVVGAGPSQYELVRTAARER